MYYPINGWTKQRILDVIKARPFKEKAFRNRGGVQVCVYLTPSGNKCGVGLFIPDGHKAQHSGYGVCDLLKKYPSLREYMPLDDLGLQGLQHTHDIVLPGGDARQAMIDWVEAKVSDSPELKA